MKRRPLAIGGVLMVVLLVVAVALAGVAMAAQTTEGPEQPVAFPHSTHAVALGISCTYCHSGAETGNPVVPSTEQCLFCHVSIKTSSPEIQKLVNSYRTNTPIDWVRVHRQPDHVGFVHSPHINAGVDCATCHGNVAEMTKVKQVRLLGMGDCVNCHRQNGAPVDCATCHQ